MRKNITHLFCFVFAVLLVNTAWAQNEKRAVFLANTIKSSTLKTHVKILSSDDMEGRECGKPGQKKAAVYLRQQLQKVGVESLSPNYFQKFPLLEVSLMQIEVIVNGRSLQFGKEFQHYKNFDNVSLTGLEAVFLGYGDKHSSNGYKNVNVSGKAVFMLDFREGEDNVPLKERIQHAKALNAKAVFVIQEHYSKEGSYIYEKIQKLGTDSFEYDIPVLHVSKELADSLLKNFGGPKLEKWLSKKKKKQKNYALDLIVDVKVNTVSRKISSENVLGFISGKEKKNEVLVLMAHYDHLGIKGKDIYNGADDNATGVAALLEIAEAFSIAKEMGGGFRRSVLILLVSGEEKGLLGSKYYCEHPEFSMKQTIATLNIDMIGRSDTLHPNDPNYVYVIGSNFISDDLHEVNEKQNAVYSKLKLDYRYNNKSDPNRFYYRSDHYNFAERGVPSIFYFSGIHKDYHQFGDTADKIDYSKLQKISKHIFYTAWKLVTMDENITKN